MTSEDAAAALDFLQQEGLSFLEKSVLTKEANEVRCLI